VFKNFPEDIRLSGAQPVSVFAQVLSSMKSPPELTEEGLQKCSVKELKQLCLQFGIANFKTFLEKSEFVNALVQHHSPVCDPNDPTSC
jgi:hypothetical protein